MSGPTLVRNRREAERLREEHRQALAILARGSEERIPFAKGTGLIPIVLFVRTFVLLDG
jgi:hypothetical protein